MRKSEAARAMTNMATTWRTRNTGRTTTMEASISRSGKKRVTTCKHSDWDYVARSGAKRKRNETKGADAHDKSKCRREKG